MRDRIFIILDSKEKRLLDYYDDGILYSKNILFSYT